MPVSPAKPSEPSRVTTTATRAPESASPASQRASWLRRNVWRPAGWYASLIGWSSRRTIPRPLRRSVFGTFSRAVGASLDEVEHDLADYPTFGEFFARRLRDGARDFTLAADEIACPCDGTLATVGVADAGTLIQAKGHTYHLDELLADGGLATRLDGGWYATIYLSPADYHRVHAPLDGKIVGHDYVPGSLWPVKPFFTRTVSGLLARNERVVIQLETAIGPVAVVMIAAVGVGHLRLLDRTVDTDAGGTRRRRERRRVELSPPIEVQRGDELGAFLLGSTVVVVFPPGTVQPAAIEPGTAIRCGQPLGKVRARGGDPNR
jgi:phosphatidylserine decarboxylase